MMYRLRFLSIMVISLGMVSPIFAAQGTDPDWPCIQRKVPALSFGQIWTGKDLPVESQNWQINQKFKDLVSGLAARRLPIPDAESRIDEFAAALDSGERELVLSQLINGLFETMDHERSQVISGIARYAHGQNSMAQSLREESAALDRLRERPDNSAVIVDQEQQKLLFRMRIFKERAQSLTYVCEVPTLVEQRLFALVRAIAKHMPSR